MTCRGSFQPVLLYHSTARADKPPKFQVSEQRTKLQMRLRNSTGSYLKNSLTLCSPCIQNQLMLSVDTSIDATNHRKFSCLNYELLLVKHNHQDYLIPISFQYNF